MVRLSFSIIISASLIIAITSAFFGEELMLLMYTRFEAESQHDFMLRIHESASIFNLLMFSFVAISSNYIFGTLLTANNSLKSLNIVAFSGLVINILLNLILIPKLYAYGSAIASLSSQGLTAVLQMIIAIRILRLDIHKRLIFGLLATVVLLVAIGYVLQEIQSINWLLSLSIMLVAGTGIAFAFKLLNIKEFISILKED